MRTCGIQIYIENAAIRSFEINENSAIVNYCEKCIFSATIYAPIFNLRGFSIQPRDRYAAYVYI